MTGAEYLLGQPRRRCRPAVRRACVDVNPVTFRHLDALGIAPGWRCWEVGAGGPTVPAWLAERVGSDGYVLAMDLDVSWVGGDGSVAFDVRRHDVAQDDPPIAGFDLIHARLVLVHVPGRDEALRRMLQSLRPGGWLLLEDFDPALLPIACPEAHGADQELANKSRPGFLQLLARRGVDLEYGRKLPRLLRQAGLQEVAADAYFPVALKAAGPGGRQRQSGARGAGCPRPGHSRGGRAPPGSRGGRRHRHRHPSADLGLGSPSLAQRGWTMLGLRIGSFETLG
jgi:SAM-dependent methyltransferase